MRKTKRVYPRRLAKSLARYLLNKHAEEVKIIDLTGVNSISDFFVIATGNSERHVLSLAEHIMKEMGKKGYSLSGEEGMDLGRWALLDYGYVIVHILTREMRKFYDIDGLWADCDHFYINEQGGIKSRR